MTLLPPTVRRAVLAILETVDEMESWLLREAVIEYRSARFPRGLKWLSGIWSADFYVEMYHLETSGRVHGRRSVTITSHVRRARIFYRLVRAQSIAPSDPMPTLVPRIMSGPICVVLALCLLAACATKTTCRAGKCSIIHDATRAPVVGER